MSTREEQREYQRRWCAERRQQSLVDRSCDGCGSTEQLEWHHLDPSEKITHAIWSWSDERRAKELEKCVPLCHDCHAAVTSRQRRADAIARNPHGTQRRYGLGCRCDSCRVAHATYNREHPPRTAAA